MTADQKMLLPAVASCVHAAEKVKNSLKSDQVEIVFLP
jgi:hypothetical protein